MVGGCGGGGAVFGADGEDGGARGWEVGDFVGRGRGGGGGGHFGDG